MGRYHRGRWMLRILLAAVTAAFTQDLSSKELTDARSPAPSAFLPVTYEVQDADALFLKEAGQDFMRNSSTLSHTQPFVLLRCSRQPSINASYGSMSTQQPVPGDLVQTVRLFNAPEGVTYNWRIRAFMLTPRVTSSKPKVRVLFYVAGRDWDRGEGAEDELPCVTVYAFWQTQEVRGSCSLGGARGTCMAELAPPPGWFAPGSDGTSRERQDPTAGNPVELYYQARPKLDGRCDSVDGSRWGGSQQQAEPVPVTAMQRIGSVRLLQVPKGMATLSRLKLGNAIVIRMSSKPLKKTNIATFYVLMASSAQLTNFTLRAAVKKGVAFRTATPSNSLLWDITLDMAADGAIAVVCQRKAPVPGRRPEGSLLEVLQMDFQVEQLSSPLDSQVIVWKLELMAPPTNGAKTEGAMRIYTSQTDFAGLAPLVMVSRPIGAGAVPVLASKRASWNSDDDDRKGRGCMLQFQHALVRVLTHFVAEQSDPQDPTAYFLGSDWQVDVTRLVRVFMKVEDPRVARLQAGRVLSGRDLGTTAIQVFSPLSDAILAKTTIKVVDDKVTITDLGVQLVAGLTVTLQLSPGSDRAILATTTTEEVLQNPKQKALVSSWVRFSDGNQTPLDIYDAADYRLTVTSLDRGVASVQGAPLSVVAEGEGEGVLVRVDMSICEACQKSKRKSSVAVGSGSLKVKFQAKGSAIGNEDNDYGRDGQEGDIGRPSQDPSGRSSTSDGEESVMQKITTTMKATERTFRTSGSLGGVGRTSKEGSPSGPPNSPPSTASSVSLASTVKAPGNLVNYNDPPTKAGLPGQESEVEPGGGRTRPLSDLEVGLYALLGVFCLAILVFLVNCVSYVVRFRPKKPPPHGQEPAGHRHDWVWLGTDAELVMSVPGSPVQPDSQTTTTVIDIGPGGPGRPRRPGCLASATDSPRCKPLRPEPLPSPTSKRKRVQFTTFSTLERRQPPRFPPTENGHGIHWVGKEGRCDGEPQGSVPEPAERL
ncbi:transmembrane protein 132D [Brachionichthys hirsutus]|uniref:transmembrane protein 132D n=1 Tax=Brachionichthys hirsutus TaxID=412623 RepID=UPI0036047DFA